MIGEGGGGGYHGRHCSSRTCSLRPGGREPKGRSRAREGLARAHQQGCQAGIGAGEELQGRPA